MTLWGLGQSLRLGIAGYLIPVCTLAFVASSGIKLLSLRSLLTGLRTTAGVKFDFMWIFSNHPLRRGLTARAFRVTAVAGT